MLTPAIQPFDAQPLPDPLGPVTRGAQGIGRGIAQAVLGAGGSVAIGDVDAEAGSACLREWNLGRRALFVRLDVTSEASVRRALERVTRTFGRFDGLVNNAGCAEPHVGPLDQLALADWYRFIDSHLTGAFLCCRYALPALRTSSGSVVNIASTRALQSEPHTEPYAAAKGGLVAFTHALAVSEGPRVRANAISPGWVPTDAWRKPTARRRARLSRADHQQHPAGRAGEPEDIGGLAVYLLSTQAGFITGQNFVVDGGMTRSMLYRE